MPYVERDPGGKIIAVYAAPTAEASEKLPASDPALQAFFTEQAGAGAPKQFLRSSDADLVRVVEDLIDLLVQKNIILFTELPTEAQQKLVNRRKARDVLRGDDDLIVDQDDII